MLVHVEQLLDQRLDPAAVERDLLHQLDHARAGSSRRRGRARPAPRAGPGSASAAAPAGRAGPDRPRRSGRRSPARRRAACSRAPTGTACPRRNRPPRPARGLRRASSAPRPRPSASSSSSSSSSSCVIGRRRLPPAAARAPRWQPRSRGRAGLDGHHGHGHGRHLDHRRRSPRRRHRPRSPPPPRASGPVSLVASRSMMSRSSTRPSRIASRQPITARIVSGLSHSAASTVLRPASMRLAISISPSRESSSIVPISRRYMRTGSSVRPSSSSGGGGASSPSAASPAAGSPSAAGSASAASASMSPAPSSRTTRDVLGVEQLDDLLRLLGREVLRQGRVQLVEGDRAAILGLPEQTPQLRVVLQDRFEPVAHRRLGRGLATRRRCRVLDRLANGHPAKLPHARRHEGRRTARRMPLPAQTRSGQPGAPADSSSASASSAPSRFSKRSSVLNLRLISASSPRRSSSSVGRSRWSAARCRVAASMSRHP